jgi:putative DNA primase/helicase
MFKLFFILYGDHDSGKSTYCNLLKTFLDQKNVSAIPIQELQQRFRSTGLIDKLANIVADLPSKAIKDTGMIKALTGNDLIGAEIKGGKLFEFTNTAKLIFSCNELPWISQDTDDAFYERVKFVPFPNMFNESTMDRELDKKLTTDDELSGFLNLVLVNLHEMVLAKSFKARRPADENRQIWERMMDGNSLTIFLNSNMVVKSPQVWVSKDEFYKAYAVYCTQNAEIPLTQSKLSREMINRHKIMDFYPKSLKSVNPANKQVHAWKGIHIR